MKKKIILVILFLVMGFNSNSDLAIEGKSNIKYVKKKNKYNLRYNNISKKQQLDVYYPNKIKSNNDNPVIIFFHGGSYLDGKRRAHIYNNKKNFNKSGFVYVPVSYRLSGENAYPAAIDDAKTAIRYLKYNRKKLKINPNKIIVMGYSAGANLASMATSTPYVKSFGTEPTKYGNMSSRVAGFIGIAGFYDVEELFKDFSDTSKSKLVNRNIHRYYYNQNKEIQKRNIIQGNPTEYIKRTSAPALLFHGDNDTTIDYKQTTNYCKSLRESGNKKVSCYQFKGKSHAYNNFTSKSHYNKMIYWAKRITK